MGVYDDEEIFSWRLQIKLEGSTREGLQQGSSVPRISSRMPTKKGFTYLNPFTGQTGTRADDIGIPGACLDHIPLNYPWGKLP